MPSATASRIRFPTRNLRRGGPSPTPTISPSSAATPGLIEASRRVIPGARRREPGIIIPTVDMDSGQPLRGFWNDDGEWALGACRQRPSLSGGALTQRRDELFLGHRLTEQEALSDVAAHAGERQRVGGLLDSDRDREAAEIVREIDDGLAERRIDAVGAAVGNEDRVELELGERQRF